jgi:microcystin degradation protein MlrC
MPRIALAGFVHETNTFSTLPTEYENFAAPKGMWPGLVRGSAIVEPMRGKRLNQTTCGFIAKADTFGWELAPIALTFAEPSRQVSINAFERIMGVIAGGLSDSLPIDAVYLDLHGAMVYEDFKNGETEIIRRVRAIVGDIPLLVSLDLHGNITPQEFEVSSAMVGYRTYPHTDSFETGERCAILVKHLLEGKPLYKAFRQIPYLIPISSQSTNTEPSRSIYARIPELEASGKILSATIMMGFPPADIYDMGPSLWTYATTQKAADEAAELLYQAIMEKEADYSLHLFSADEAVLKAMQLAEKADKPVILADVQDNSGGGASSDTPGVLEALVRHNAQQAALALMFDAESAALAHQIGEGKEGIFELGGKLTPGQKPYKGKFLVEKLAKGEFPLTGPMGRGMTTDLGKMALLRIGGVQVVVASERTQANDQSYFRQVGVEPSKMKIIVVKSANHYRADFEPISSAIFSVESPGAIIEDPTKATYRYLRPGVRLKPLGPEQK